MADYWMKLYIEILDDPKMATLPDRVWRRVIELFLVAKKIGKDGHLPDTRQIAWLLRMNPDDLEHDMMQIASTEIIVREVGGWYIPKFAQRQAAVPDAERKSQERIRRQSQQYYEDVTNQSRNVTQINRLTESDTDTETDKEINNDFLSRFTATTRVGVTDVTILNELEKMEKEYPANFWDALTWAACTSPPPSNALKYAKMLGTALPNWKKGNGKSNGKPISTRKLKDADGNIIEVEQ